MNYYHQLHEGALSNWLELNNYETVMTTSKGAYYHGFYF